MDFAGKVVLVTGGASGIGACCVKEFLKLSVKGVTIADIDSVLGEQTTKKFNNEFGNDKVIFVKTNVADKHSFDNAFKKTIEVFGNIDILVNNAGIFNELEWEKVIQVNLVGTTNGCLLAINHYFPKYKSGLETYIVNIVSIAGMSPIPAGPHYCSSKHGIIGLTRSFGINKTLIEGGIYIMAVCPGATITAILDNITDKVVYKDLLQEQMADLSLQEPDAVGKCVIEALLKRETGSVWSVVNNIISKVNIPTFEQLVNS